MRAMEVKKNGKVEHSLKSHDDQVFSWLMALYVWYDGENLADRFHIWKSTIKTDDEEEIFDTELDEQLNPKELINLEKFQDADDGRSEEIIAAYQFIEDNKPIVTSSQFKDMTELSDLAQRNTLLTIDKKARDAFCRQYGVDPNTFGGESSATATVKLPDHMFNINDDNVDLFGNDMDDDRDPYSMQNRSPLVGNLSQYWDDV